MKTTPLILLSWLLCVQVVAQKNKPTAPPTDFSVPLTADRWESKTGKIEFVEHKGVKAMKLLPNLGEVELKGLLFGNGTIEYDVELLAQPSQALYFHRQSEREEEIFYLRDRLGKPNANDAVQYAPIIDGVNLWDLMDAYQAPALIKDGEWNHVKLVISGLQMRVYVNDMTRPCLAIPQLEGTVKQGNIAFGGSCVVANVTIKPNATEGLPAVAAPDLTDHDAHYLRKWAVSKPVALPKGTELFSETLPKSEAYDASVDAERRGLVNLTRQFGKSVQRRVVWLKVKLKVATAHTNLLRLGFSDEVWVFLNNQPVYVDKNLYRQNMRKYPDGRISILNASLPLAFKAGENELVIGVANDFYGWGLMARLDELEGIEVLAETQKSN